MHTKVLLLSPWFFPLKVIRWEDAIKMVYEKTVNIIVEYDETVSSPSVTWKMPAVLQLKKLSGKMKNGIKFSRQNVYTRDGYRCQYCGNRFAASLLSYDHVVPKSAGGRRCWENIVTACKPCNLRKADKTCDEAGMWPLREPKIPRSLPLTGPTIDIELAPPEWHGFIGIS